MLGVFLIIANKYLHDNRQDVLMKKKWREFEKLVSRVEELLSPQGAVVKSPDRIKDKVTGRMREVDVSIRYVVGSVNILITIECRDRKAVPDDTWIEQLATKKQKIGASHTVAVSSTNFTKPAIKSAQLYGIELRVIKNITDEDILSWLGRIRIVNEIGKVGFEGIQVEVYGDSEDTQLASDVLEAIEKDKLQAMIFYSEGDDKKVSIADLLGFFVKVYTASRGSGGKTNALKKKVLKPGDTFDVELQPGYMSLFDDVPVNVNGLGRKETFAFDLLYGGLLVQTVKGPMYVKRVEFELVLAKETREMPISRKIQYATTEKRVSSIVESDIELFQYDRKKEIILSYSIPDEENGPVIMMVTDKEVENNQDESI
jgi:hypothetical protein